MASPNKYCIYTSKFLISFQTRKDCLISTRNKKTMLHTFQVIKLLSKKYSNNPLLKNKMQHLNHNLPFKLKSNKKTSRKQLDLNRMCLHLQNLKNQDLKSKERNRMVLKKHKAKDLKDKIVAWRK